MNRINTVTAGLALALCLAAPLGAIADDKAPMPQTRGMQGMDPKLHDQPADKADPRCTPSAEKAAQQAKHPMPETRGMQGMDPKAHKVDCPPAPAAKADPAKHVHKQGVN